MKLQKKLKRKNLNLIPLSSLLWKKFRTKLLNRRKVKRYQSSNWCSWATQQSESRAWSPTTCTTPLLTTMSRPSWTSTKAPRASTKSKSSLNCTIPAETTTWKPIVRFSTRVLTALWSASQSTLDLPTRTFRSGLMRSHLWWRMLLSILSSLRAISKTRRSSLMIWRRLRRRTREFWAFRRPLQRSGRISMCTRPSTRCLAVHSSSSGPIRTDRVSPRCSVVTNPLTMLALRLA